MSLKINDIDIVKAYKENEHIENAELRNFLQIDAVIAILKRSIANSLYVAGSISATIGFLSLFSFWEKLINNRKTFDLIIGILLIALLTSFLCYAYKYANRNIDINISGIKYSIMQDDYIANMLKKLYESKANEKNQILIFAIGMNESILENPFYNGNRIPYKSVAKSFDEFMSKYFNIDITSEIQKLYKGKELPRVGEVFPVNFVLKTYNESSNTPIMKKLEGAEFTVLFYVNSYNENGLYSNERVEDARYTTAHIVDYCSDYIYEIKKKKNVNVVFMIPAIGSGKSGNGSYKNILISIVNNFAIPNYSTPDELILSLRDYKMLVSEYNAENILILAKKINEL